MRKSQNLPAIHFKSVLIFIAFLFTTNLTAQVNFSLVVESGVSNTTCTDAFGGAIEERWRVNVEGTGWVRYPEVGVCYTALPNTQWSFSYGCPTGVPTTVNVCFAAYENDGFETGIGCTTTEDCVVELCDDFTLPAAGASINHTLTLPAGGASEGEVNFRIDATGQYLGGTNDLVCNAFDLGVLNGGGDVIGDASLSSFSNLCSSNTGDPSTAGAFGNDQGVWFQFTTGPDPIPYATISGRNDPEGLGDDISLQIAIFRSFDGTCNTVFGLLESSHQTDSWDEEFTMPCLLANTTYYIIVDGAFVSGSGIGIEGFFGLEVSSTTVTEGADLICDAADMGQVPEGGAILFENYSNECSDDIGELDPSEFSGQRTVWFTFTTPASGHVMVNAISDLEPPLGIASIGLQIAVYESANDMCWGPLIEVGSSYTSGDVDELFEASCLEPGSQYWILIDGDGGNTTGVFDLSISDAGPLPPQSITTLNPILCQGDSLVVGDLVFYSDANFDETLDAYNGCDSVVNGSVTFTAPELTSIDTVLCHGETIQIGSTIYDRDGIYQETLTAFDGCDSIVDLDLEVLDILLPNLMLDIQATGYLTADGTASANVSGGATPYTYLWSNTQVTPTATNLQGGTNACVTVTDDNGCTVEDCILVLFPSNILTSIQNDTVTCPGDNDGSLVVSIANGAVPYNFTWENGDASLTGIDSVTTEGGFTIVPNLPSGNYSFTITDAFGVVVSDGEIFDPAALITTIDTVLCFGEDIMVGGNVYSSTGPINEMLNSIDGCDSLVTGSIIVNNQITTSFDTTLCFGQSLVVGTTIHVTTGPFNETLPAFDGCDSIVSGMLTVLNDIFTNIDTTICAGEIIEVGSNQYNSTNTTTEVLTSSSGCDSTVNLNLTVLPPIFTTMNERLCFGDSLIIGTEVFNADGNYSIVLPSYQNCDSTIWLNLDIQDELILDLVLDTDATGYLIADGVATANVMGGSGGYNFEWSTLDMTQTVNNLQGGTNVCVTVTDTEGCQDEDCTIILFPSNILSVVENDTLTCIGDTDGSLSLSVSNGAVPYGYIWENQDASLTGSGIIPIEGGNNTIDNLPIGEYSFTITDAFGVVSVQADVVNPDPIVTSIDTILCFGESISVAGNVYNSTGPISEIIPSFQGCDSSIVGQVQVLPAISTVIDTTICFGDGVLIGTTVYSNSGAINENLTSFNGCDSVVSGSVIVLNEIVFAIDTSICAGEFITVGNSTYNQTNTYQEIIPAFNGCDSIITTTLEVYDPLDLQITNPIEATNFGVADGTLEGLVTGGSGNFTSEWNNLTSGLSASGLEGGTEYCLTVTDMAGCSVVECATVGFPVIIMIAIENDTLDCSGDLNGSIDFSPSNGLAPYAYLWEQSMGTLTGSGMANTEGETIEIPNLPVGNYNITVTDAFGAAVITASVIEPDPININLVSQLTASCFGICDGGAVVSANGGTGVLTYLWDDGTIGDELANACAGVHLVTVSDENNCQEVIQVDIIQPDEPIVTTMELNQVSCFGATDGSATVTGNIIPTAWLWDNGETTNVADSLTAGMHTVTVFYNTGCSFDATVNISQPPSAISLSFDLIQELDCHDSEDATVQAQASGGTGFQYAWSNGGALQELNNLSAGTYILTVEDGNGCALIDSIILDAPQELTGELSTVDLTCAGGNQSGEIHITNPAGGTEPYLYGFENGTLGSSPDFLRLEEGDYEIVMEDAVGCTSTFSAQILNSSGSLTVDLGADQIIELGEMVNIEALSSSSNVVFDWAATSTDTLPCSNCGDFETMPMETTEYSVTALDTITGCSAEDRVLITVQKSEAVFFPSAFSPNGDGSNDTYLVFKGSAVEQITDFRIFNRWGELVYLNPIVVSGDPFNSWNGNFKNKEAPSGVYIYTAKVNYLDGRFEMLTGDITLMR